MIYNINTILEFFLISVFISVVFIYFGKKFGLDFNKDSGYSDMDIIRIKMIPRR